MDSKLLIILAASGLVSLASIFWLIRKPASISVRIFWSVIALIPLMGPLLVGAFFTWPEENPEHLKDKREPDIMPGHYWQREDTNHMDND